MSKYIDAEKIKKTFCAECNHTLKCEDCDIDYHFRCAPAADVVEVVRCKDCKHADLFYPYCTIWEAAIDGDGYCYKGEKE